MYKSKIDEEIERREKEKFEVLEKQVEDAQNNFNAAEKKEFERLWSFYCDSLNAIENRQIEITEVKNEKASLTKELNRKNFILLAFTIAINAADYFFINNNDYIPLILLITIAYFVYVQIKNDIQVTSKNIEDSKETEYADFASQLGPIFHGVHSIIICISPKHVFYTI
jgi:hypothetical protein